ncbi:hypothetical protein AYI69_g2398 [Smittium culicis]|uniref:Uncharacterized protein n=1 Tax=Smittium culicis TaxID=133412 RepID=A0A1R1YMM4_9FUNG|nr:hypothetical protein AYI69_g2398 [Smittium culicis]
MSYSINMNPSDHFKSNFEPPKNPNTLRILSNSVSEQRPKRVQVKNACGLDIIDGNKSDFENSSEKLALRNLIHHEDGYLQAPSRYPISQSDNLHEQAHSARPGLNLLSNLASYIENDKMANGNRPRSIGPEYNRNLPRNQEYIRSYYDTQKNSLNMNFNYISSYTDVTKAPNPQYKSLKNQNTNRVGFYTMNQDKNRANQKIYFRDRNYSNLSATRLYSRTRSDKISKEVFSPGPKKLTSSSSRERKPQMGINLNEIIGKPNYHESYRSGVPKSAQFDKFSNSMNYNKGYSRKPRFDIYNGEYESPTSNTNAENYLEYLGCDRLPHSNKYIKAESEEIRNFLSDESEKEHTPLRLLTSNDTNLRTKSDQRNSLSPYLSPATTLSASISLSLKNSSNRYENSYSTNSSNGKYASNQSIHRYSDDYRELDPLNPNDNFLFTKNKANESNITIRDGYDLGKSSWKSKSVLDLKLTPVSGIKPEDPKNVSLPPIRVFLSSL